MAFENSIHESRKYVVNFRPTSYLVTFHTNPKNWSAKNSKINLYLTLCCRWVCSPRILKN